MEDRSRRNNLKIRGIPESVQQSDLGPYAATLFKNLIPSLTDLDVTIDRTHRLPKPSHLSDHISRDTSPFALLSCKRKPHVIHEEARPNPSTVPKLTIFLVTCHNIRSRKGGIWTRWLKCCKIIKLHKNGDIQQNWLWPEKITLAQLPP